MPAWVKTSRSSGEASGGRSNRRAMGGGWLPLRIPASGRRNGCATSRHSFSGEAQASTREPGTRTVFSQEDPKTGGLRRLQGLVKPLCSTVHSSSSRASSAEAAAAEIPSAIRQMRASVLSARPSASSLPSLASLIEAIRRVLCSVRRFLPPLASLIEAIRRSCCSAILSFVLILSRLLQAHS